MAANKAYSHSNDSSVILNDVSPKRLKRIEVNATTIWLEPLCGTAIAHHNSCNKITTQHIALLIRIQITFKPLRTTNAAKRRS